MTGPVMIFAAGLGTRMRPLTDDMPKAMVRVAGRPLIDHALDIARGIGAPRIVVNLHHMGGALRRHLQGQDVLFSPEQTLLDTGGGLKAALPLLRPGPDGPVFSLNPDAAWRGPNPLAVLADAWRSEHEALLLVANRPNSDFAMDRSGRLARGGPYVYTGAQIIRTARIAAWPGPAFSLNRVWDAMIADGAARAVVYPGQWLDVGSPDAIAPAEAVLRGAE